MEVPCKCVVCGKSFVGHKLDQKYCSHKCRDAERYPGMNEVWRKAKAEREAKAERRRSFLARRDTEYAANAPKVTVDERALRDSELGMVMRRVETRGFCPCASALGIRHQLVTDKGVVYFA